MGKDLINHIEENIDYDGFYKTTINLLQKQRGKVSVRVYGGEILADEFPDSHIISVFDYIEKVYQYCNENKLEVDLSLGSNLLFTNVDRVLEQCEKHKYCPIRTSFDFKYRFNDKTLLLFEQNYNKLKDYISDVSLVANKSNYKGIQEQNEYKRVFELIYNDGKKVNLINYIASSDDYKEELLTTDEYLDFYKYVYKNYPNVIQVRDIVRNVTENLTCKCMNCVGAGINPDGKITTCCLYQYNKDRYMEKNITLENRGVLASNKLSCFTCPYYNKVCVTPCPLSIVTSGFDKDCYVRRFIDWIKEQ
jgi:hypothetical protein